jgi:acyl homoserine lactone synthase
MILVVEKYNAPRYSHLIDKMHRLRARIFHDRLGWDVQVVDGKERDKYDDEEPVYIIYTDDKAREVKGSLRLLPTTGPTVLAECFADTLPDAGGLSAPTIWEGTRFCIDDRLFGPNEQMQLKRRDREPLDPLVFACGEMITGLGDIAVRAGIESIVGNFDASMLRLYRRIGCPVEILGCTSRYGQPIYLGLFPISEFLVRRVKRRLANSRPAFERMEQMVA